MTETIAPTRSAAVQTPRRIPLRAGPAAAAEARCQVQAAIFAWGLPVDASVAVLLTSELVTNAIRHQAGGTATLVVTCAGGQLRVDVHDTSSAVPVLMDAPAEAEAGRGLMLVASLATDWGYYRTPAGKVVYFTLALRADAEEGSGRAKPGHRRCAR
jgi:anti-sigma regulatory factor (Ser/Thr protein kinase)